MNIVIPERAERKYKPYDEYKDSAVEWLKTIPAHWEAKRLRFLTKINPSKTDIKTSPPSFDVSFLPMEDVGCGILNMEQTRELSSVSEGYTYFRDGDVLVAKITPCFENGKGAISEGLLNGIGFGTTELHVIRATLDLNRRFLLYITISHVFRDIGESQMYGAAGQKRVSDKFIRDFICPYPSLEEQQAIADFLDRETTRIDELIARNQRLIDLLQEQRTALITRTVTKGLNPDAPMKYSGVEWLGKIPEHWEVKKLKWTITSCSNGIWGDEETGENDVVCIRVADFDRMRLKVVGDNLTWRSIPSNMLSRRKLQKGDLLLEKSGGGEQQPVGAVVIYELDYEAVCSNFIACMKIADGHNSRLLNYFHYALYSSGVNIRSIKQTTGIQNLDSYHYLNELIPVPDINEQQAIVDYLDQETSRIDNLVSKINQAIERLHEYRSALITAAVTGKIDVR